MFLKYNLKKEVKIKTQFLKQIFNYHTQANLPLFQNLSNKNCSIVRNKNLSYNLNKELEIKLSHKHKLIISKNYSFNNMESNHVFTTKEETLNFLKNQGVGVAHVEDHEKLDTVPAGLERMKAVDFKAGSYTFVKNLFLKNKAGGYYLLTVHPVSSHKYLSILKLGINSQLQNCRKINESQKRFCQTSRDR